MYGKGGKFLFKLVNAAGKPPVFFAEGRCFYDKADNAEYREEKSPDNKKY